MTNELNDRLLELASTLRNGESGRFVCPSCGGGSTRERCMTIRIDGLTAHCTCWRANCDIPYRTVMVDGSINTYKHTSRPVRRTFWDEPTLPLPPGILEEGDRFGVRLSEDGRLVIPICDQSGRRKGDCIRQLKPYNTRIPKALTLAEEGYDGMGWYDPKFTEDRGVTCVVEDAISAMRLAVHGVTGVALLGTRITEDRVKAFIEWGQPINLALDADAHMAAVRQAINLRNRLDIRVHRLYHDVKDMDEKELLNFLGVLGV